MFLVARDAARLDAVAADLRSRGAAAVDVRVADLADPAEQARVVAAAVAQLGTLSHTLIAHGVLPDRDRADADPGYARQTLDVNFLSPAALCMHIAPHLERQRSGCLAVIGSVAGDRIRLSNYVYGSAKGALITLPQRTARPPPAARHRRPHRQAGVRRHAHDRGHAQGRAHVTARPRGARHLPGDDGPCQWRRLHPGLLALHHVRDPPHSRGYTAPTADIARGRPAGCNDEEAPGSLPAPLVIFAIRGDTVAHRVRQKPYGARPSGQPASLYPSN
jgi:hypothetical protein